jgi:hypothetical protein
MLHVSTCLADRIEREVLAYLLMGSYATLLGEWGRGRVGKPVPTACVAPT